MCACSLPLVDTNVLGVYDTCGTGLAEPFLAIFGIQDKQVGSDPFYLLKMIGTTPLCYALGNTHLL